MDELNTASGIIALAGAGAALLALIVATLSLRRVSAVARTQSVVLGNGESRDLVSHAAELERELGRLAKRIDESGERMDAGFEGLRSRLDGAVTHVAVIRYDAMGEMTGRQSSSVALLDSRRTGVVFSAILNRDSARLYAKQVVGGESEFALTPEEHEALRTALANGGKD